MKSGEIGRIPKLKEYKGVSISSFNLKGTAKKDVENLIKRHRGEKIVEEKKMEKKEDDGLIKRLQNKCMELEDEIEKLKNENKKLKKTKKGRPKKSASKK